MLKIYAIFLSFFLRNIWKSFVCNKYRYAYVDEKFQIFLFLNDNLWFHNNHCIFPISLPTDSFIIKEKKILLKEQGMGKFFNYQLPTTIKHMKWIIIAQKHSRNPYRGQHKVFTETQVSIQYVKLLMIPGISKLWIHF